MELRTPTDEDDRGPPPSPGRRSTSGRLLLSVALVLSVCLAFAPPAFTEGPSRFERERTRMMLNIVKKDLVKYYYDETFHGQTPDEAFKAADEKIDRAHSLSQLLAAISLPLLDLDDSHTYFIPPERSARFHFGWRMQAIGDRCYVTSVQEGSDAEAKGVRKGDRVLTVNDRELSRDNLWDLIYAHRVLAPRATLPMVVQSPGEEPRRVDVAARVEERKVIVRRDSPFDLGDYRREMENEAYLSRPRFKEVSEDLLIRKMPELNLTGDEVRTLMNRMRKYKCLIL